MSLNVSSIWVSPVKSLRLVAIDHARFEKPGIAGDRAFHLVDANGRLFTQRECPALTRVFALYDRERDALRLSFPDGTVVESAVELGGPTQTMFFGRRPVAGRVVEGPFGRALSAYAGQELRLVKPDVRGAAFDGYPISLCSMESLEALARAAGRDAVDGRRFRQNVYVSGGVEHGEDAWVGELVRVGTAVLRVKQLDERCVMTQHSPDTGEHDLDTLKIIASYRTDQPKQVNFGVYCTVVQEGDVAVGDALEPLGATT